MDEHQIEPMNDLNQQPQHLRGSSKKKGLNKKLLIMVSIIVAVLAVAAAAFLLLKKDAKPDSASQQQAAQQSVEEDEPTMPPAEAAQPQTYKSPALNIELTHRKDWTLAENAEKKLITLTSPKFTFQTGSDSRKDVFTLKIGFGASKEAQQNISKAVAVRDSLLIGYDAPTEAQRHYTNVSYAGPPGDDAAFFEFFIVSGSVALKTGDPFGNSIIINSGDFLIAGGFGADAQNQLNFESVPAAELEQYSAYEQALAIVKSLKVY